MPEANDMVLACTRSRLSDALLIHLYCRKMKQLKEKITIKINNALNQEEEKMFIASADVPLIINIANKARVLTESRTNCNTFIPLDLIFERLSINAKRMGTIIIFMDEKIMLYVLKI